LLFVASLFEDLPVLVDISSPVPKKQILPTILPRSQEHADAEEETPTIQDLKQATCITIFNATGSHIIAGTSKGSINIIDAATRRMIHTSKLCNGLVVYLRLTVSGRHMVINSSDRVIRTVPIPDLAEREQDVDSLKLEVEHKFQDIVNRLSWNHVAFSSTGEYVTASTYMNHDIYVWERSHGSLVKILEGPKEELGVVEVSIT
jgi:COMPASS component SWD1